MARTEAQIEADDALTAAIEGVLRAYADEDDPGIMDRYMPGEYIVVATHMGLVDGEDVSMTNVLFKDNDVSLPRAIGLARYAAAWLDHRVICHD